MSAFPKALQAILILEGLAVAFVLAGILIFIPATPKGFSDPLSSIALFGGFAFLGWLVFCYRALGAEIPSRGMVWAGFLSCFPMVLYLFWQFMGASWLYRP